MITLEAIIIGHVVDLSGHQARPPRRQATATQAEEEFLKPAGQMNTAWWGSAGVVSSL